MTTTSTRAHDIRSRSRAGCGLRLLGLWFLDCCAATAWFVPYQSMVWRDWRTDVRLHHFDVELRQLVAGSRSEDPRSRGLVPPVAE